MHFEENVVELVNAFAERGGRGLVVGGAVRDHLLGTQSNDIDIEVHGLPWDDVTAICKSRFAADTCGESFAVLKLHSVDIDVAIPRREVPTGDGHTDFEVTSDPHMGIEEAFARRDFTVNAIGYDPLTGELVDPYGGAADLTAGVLRHVSHRFAEDALRVMRGAQFASRFGLTMAPETIELCRGLTPNCLPRERTSAEWVKLLKGVTPSKGLEVLRDTGWLQFFPALQGIDLDSAGERLDRLRSSDDAELWACFTQDLEEGAGGAVTELSGFVRLARDAQALVAHLGQLETATQLRHTAHVLGGLRSVLTVADAAGADTQAAWIQTHQENILDNAPKPLVTGKDLMAAGLVAGSDLGETLRRLLDVQFQNPQLDKQALLAMIN